MVAQGLRPLALVTGASTGIGYELAKYLPQLLERVEKGEIDPSFVITHRASLQEGPELYKTFRDKKDGCIKVVMKP